MITPAAFVGGTTGAWKVERITAVAGESLAPVERIAVVASREGGVLDERSPPLGRPEAT